MDIIQQFSLKGKKALVTGGGSGIGRSITHALAEAGADVAIVDINTELAEKVVDEVKKIGRESFFIRADVSKDEDVENMANEIVKTFKRLDIAVNNAGTSCRGNAENLDIDDWDKVIKLNLRGSFLCAQKEAKIMIPQKYGKIIFVSSISSSIINLPQFHIAYGASKAGVDHLVKGLAVEWIKHGVYVNGINPGAIYTPFVKNAKDLKDLIKVWEEYYPIKRLGYPEEIKGAVVYLASDASNFTVGHNMVIDGGYTCL